MDRKTIVIAWVTVAVVSATWLAQQTSQRSTNQNELVLVAPKLRQQDTRDREPATSPRDSAQVALLALRSAEAAQRVEPESKLDTSESTSVATWLPPADPELVPGSLAVAPVVSPPRSREATSADILDQVELTTVESTVAQSALAEPSSAQPESVESTSVEPASVESAMIDALASSAPVDQTARAASAPPAASATPNAPTAPVTWVSETVANAGDDILPRVAPPDEKPSLAHGPSLSPSNASLRTPSAPGVALDQTPEIPPLARPPSITTQASLQTSANTASAPIVAQIASTTSPLPTATPALPPEAPRSSVAPGSLSGAVLQRAASHLEYGRSLARRGSLYTARGEFLAGLKLIVESLDAQADQQVHTVQFDRALRAIKEAQDFVPNADDESILMPLVEITRSHQSDILTPEQCQGLTPMKAMQAYFSYASTQLAAACGQVPAASELLHALGKLHALMARDEVSQPSVQRAISLVMHQAAVVVDPQNYQSANELGVALANLGYPHAAKAALLQSLSVEPTVPAWGNLASVHRQLGEDALAAKADREKDKLAASQAQLEESGATSQIRWVSPEEFAVPSASAADDESPPVASSNPSMTPPARSVVPEKKPMWDQFKNAFRAR